MLFGVVSVNQPFKHLWKLLHMQESCTVPHHGCTSQSHIAWGHLQYSDSSGEQRVSPKGVPLRGKTNSGSEIEEPKNKHCYECTPLWMENTTNELFMLQQSLMKPNKRQTEPPNVLLVIRLYNKIIHKFDTHII